MKKRELLGYGAIYLTISKTITLIISTITVMLLARFRTLDEYGTYSELLLVVNLATTVFMLGLPNCINYFLARSEKVEERRQFLSVYYTLSTCLSILIGLILVCSVPLIEKYFKNNEISCFICFLALYPWTSIITSSIENVLVVYQKTSLLIYYRLVYSIFLLATVVVTKILGLGFKEFIWLFLMVNIIFAIVVYIMVNNICDRIGIFLNKELIKNILIFSIPLGFASVVGTLDIEIDKLLIGYIMPTDMMAIYTNASKELPVTVVATSITAVLLPRMVSLIKKGKDEDAVYTWGVATELSWIFMTVIVAGVFTYAEDVMNFLYSEKYLAGIGVFRIYTLVLLLRCTYWGIVLNAKGETKLIMVSSIVALGLNALLNPLLYVTFGMIGPAIATLGSIFLVGIFQLVLSAKLTNVSLKKILPWSQFLKILVINIAMAFVFFISKEILLLDIYVGSFFESLILGVCWLCVYILILRKRIVFLWNELNTYE